jgi:hypothetical protein
LLALAVLIALICLLRVGVDAAYEAGTLTLKVVAGPVNLTLLPKKPKPKESPPRRPRRKELLQRKQKPRELPPRRERPKRRKQSV